MRVALAVLVLIAVISVPALADSSGTAVASVYIYDRPELSVSLLQSGGSLICAWDISDNDEQDTFIAKVDWVKDGRLVSNESVECGSLRHCAALERPVPAVSEAWKCSVTVTDSYNAAGSGSAEFQLTPLGFFGGLLRVLLSFFKLG